MYISFCLTLLATTGVHAQRDSRKQKAAEYFQQGEILFTNQDFAKAAQAFKLAYNLSPHPSVLANIAVSFDQAGKIPDAVNFYRQYMVHAGTSKEDRKMRARLRKLEPRVANLDIRCSVTPCQIRVNGMKQSGDNTVVVLPGSHQIEAISDGYETAEMTVSAQAGKVSTVEMTLEPSIATTESDGEPLPVVTDTDKDSKKGVLGIPFWIATGTTGAAAIVTLVLGIRTAKLGREFESTEETDSELKDKGESMRLATNIMLGLTIAAAATAASFAIYDVVKAKKKRERKKIALLPGPGLGVAFVHQF